MDLTIHQLRKGHLNDLLSFKSEITSYLANKKQNTKSTTLLTTLQKLNKELRCREEKQKRIQDFKRQNRDKDDTSDDKLSFAEFPAFLQDNIFQLTSKKRVRTEESRDDSDLFDSYNSCFGIKKDLSLDFENDFEDYSDIFYSKDNRKASSSSIAQTATPDSFSREQNLDDDVYSYLCFS